MSKDFLLSINEEKHSAEKRKNAELFYAFSIDEKKGRGKSEKELNFAQINKGFYDDLITYDDNIKSSKNNLKKQKEQGIKESVYSNKRVPDSWRNKITYYQDLFSTMNKDRKFVSYLGRGNENEKNDDNNVLNKRSSFQKKNIKISTQSLLITKLDEIENESKNITQSNSPYRQKNIYNHIKSYVTDIKEIANILEEYKMTYPIKLPNEPHSTGHGGKIAFPTIINKDAAKNEPSDQQQKEKNLPTSTNSQVSSANSTSKKGLFLPSGSKKSKVFRSTIYSNLIPDKGNPFKMMGNETTKANKSGTIFTSPYLNGSSEEFFQNIEVINPTIDKKLKDIQYYGPFYSHCPPCRNRNINFYNTMEFNQCVKLLGYLKQIRKKNKYKII